MPPEAVGVVVLAVHNVAVHRVLPAPADVALHLVTAFGAAIRSGRLAALEGV